MNKAYNTIGWENRPSLKTPLGKSNLDKVDLALNEVDNRVIQLDTNKLDKATALKMVKNVTLNTTTGVLTVTLLDGTTNTYDLTIEKVVTNFRLNEKNQLVLTLADGTQQIVDLSKFIDIYTFNDTETIAITNNNKSITANIKKGSITDEYMEPGYLSEITKQAVNAESSAKIAAENAYLSQRYAVGGDTPGAATDNSKFYKEEAEKAKAAAQIAVAECQNIVASGNFIKRNELGQPGGPASLDSRGIINTAQTSSIVNWANSHTFYCEIKDSDVGTDWYTIFTCGQTIETDFAMCTIKGILHLWNYNSSVDDVPFQVVFLAYDGSLPQDSSFLYLPRIFEKDCIRIIKEREMTWRLQIRKPDPDTKIRLQFSYTSNISYNNPQLPELFAETGVTVVNDYKTNVQPLAMYDYLTCEEAEELKKIKNLYKVSNIDIDNIVEGIAIEENESEIGTDPPPAGDSESITIEEIDAVLNT